LKYNILNNHETYELIQMSKTIIVVAEMIIIM